MNLEALIFDVDGTMADTEEMHRLAFNVAFIEHQLGWNWDRSEYARLLEISGGKERIVHYIEALPQPAAEKARLHELVAAIHRSKTRLYTDFVISGKVLLRPGVARLIREARAAGMRLGVASTTTSANVEALIGGTLGPGAFGWFDVVACGDQVPHKKPAPDIYRRALATLGLPPQACVAFEDSANGVKAARAAGLFTVVTPTRWTAGQDFSAAQLVLSSLGDPDRPLDAASAAAVGAPWLGVAELVRLHAAATRAAAVSSC